MKVKVLFQRIDVWSAGAYTNYHTCMCYVLSCDTNLHSFFYTDSDVSSTPSPLPPPPKGKGGRKGKGKASTYLNVLGWEARLCQSMEYCMHFYWSAYLLVTAPFFTVLADVEPDTLGLLKDCLLPP